MLHLKGIWMLKVFRNHVHNTLANYSVNSLYHGNLCILFFNFVEAQQQTQPDKPLPPSSQAHWQRVGKEFHLHSTEFELRTFFEVQGSPKC